jgi:ABC-type nickel/cobalt efflux system permease component RcnA
VEVSIVAALSLGFWLGLRHALDPDHLIAVSTIVSEHKNIFRSSLIGTFWGFGHTISLLAVGLVVILLRVSIPKSVGLWMELPVAAMLVILGVNALCQLARNSGIELHSHAHTHEGESPHQHIHFHNQKSHVHRHQIFRLGRRPFVVGLVHGLAGSAALTLAVLTTIPSIALGLAYMALFGMGSVGGMLLMSATISLPFIATARRFAAINRGIRLVSALGSILFGVALGWQLLSEIS